MIKTDEIKMLEEIKKLDAERIGIRELRKHNTDLYGYYFSWLIKKENTMIRKYIKKFDKWPELPGTVIVPKTLVGSINAL
jgi:glutaredoxin-related protein